MVMKALSTAGKTQGEISRQVGCSQCVVSKCLQGKSSGHKKCGRKRVTTKQDDRKLTKLVRSDRFQKCGKTAQQWNAAAADEWCLQSISEKRKWATPTTYHGWSLFWFLISARSGWLGPRRSATGQLDSGLELSSLMSPSSAFHSGTKDHEFGGSPTKLTNLAARNLALNFHKAPWSGNIMGRNFSSWSWISVFSANKCHCCYLSRSLVGAFCASDDWATVWRWRVHIPTRLGFCPNAKSTKTKIISGLPRMGYTSCLGRQTLWILFPSKIFGESRKRGWLPVDRLLWSS